MDVTASYVICATPRTGSYLLCDLLDATGVAGHPTEHLSSTFQHHWQARWQATDYPAYLQRVLAEGSTDNGVFGTKLHRHQLDHVLHQVTGERDVSPERGRAVMERILPAPHWIMLSRRDHVAQAVSYTRSMQTEIWWDADADPAPPGRPRPGAARFDYAQIEAYERRLLRWERRWRNWFAGNGIEPYELHYEDLVENLGATVADVLRFLRLRAPEGFDVSAPRFRRQADATSQRWISRFNALRAAKAQRTVGALADLHRDEPVVVCGCGESVSQLDRVNERVTVGVNDIARAFTPNYHVIVDNQKRFSAERWAHIRATRADVLITNQFLDVDHPFIVRTALRESDAARLPERTSVYVIGKPWYSPYVATGVAGLLGADPIGLIGVDFSDDHFFAATGPYPGIKHLATVDAHLRRLRGVLARSGTRLANLSARSRVTALPKLDLADFDRLPPRTARADRRDRLHIVVYDPAATVSGGFLARSIWAQSGHTARFVHGRSESDALRWPDLDWTTEPGAARAELAGADLVLTLGPVRPDHEALVRSRAHVAVEADGIGPVLRLGRHLVPTPVPAWSHRCAPDERDDLVCIVVFGGDAATADQIAEAAISARVPIRLVDASADAGAELVKFYRRAHVVVDASGGGTWVHSLLGLSTGAVVLNSLGTHHLAARELARISGGADTPFEHVGHGRLVPALRHVLRAGPHGIDERGARNRRWIEQRWDFADQWQRWWLAPVTAAVRDFRRG